MYSCRIANSYLNVTKAVGCMWVCKQERSLTDMSARCNIWFFNGHFILIEKPTNTICLHNSCSSQFEKEEDFPCFQFQRKAESAKIFAENAILPPIHNTLKLAFQIFQSFREKMCEARREYFGTVPLVFFFFLNLILNCCTSKNYEYKRIHDNSYAIE